MLAEIAILLVSLGIILVGAEVFTNGVEWLGKKLCLNEGAVGSILAAVGTALPETMIPVIAIIFGGGHEEASHIGIGAILGAPFMLGTLAFFITGVAVIVNKGKRPEYPRMHINTEIMSRDLAFFLVVYTVAIAAAFLNEHFWKQVVAVFLVLAYAIYVYKTLAQECDSDDDEELSPLIFAKKNPDPSTGIVLLQVAAALGLIVVGAKFFVGSVEFLAEAFQIPAFILALIIAPVATELPEKFNSIIWVSQGKDTLALGNITGAMVFQSSVIPAIGITLTPWILTRGAFISAALALSSALLVYLQIRARKYLTPGTLLVGGIFYLIFVTLVVTGVIH
ncbi:sodium:calcium antiporter [Thermanaerosceptrum fracticalcis]|uniref:Sodium:calcium antiporter n=1 Tax=Thermanaerosceptrum fracticalcis TaxID=1712410 RepID=A0A7G6DZ50_THEFR|nr:sodium:calcium antiporter [Thermanaerosceptrum fracticalcis]QNB45104.1 sodium:calcium antiporter [Thermanaerosceptrum fracticalcis]